MLVGVGRPIPADKIPNFDVTAACRALAAEPDAIPDDMQARGTHIASTTSEQLVKQWSQFKPAIEPCVSAGPRRAPSTRSIQN
jgi:hypothetical protein